jgi:vancomycin resistance protein YoaR
MSGPFVSSVSRRRRRGRTALIVAVVVAVVAGLLAAGYGALWYLDRDRIAAGTTVGGVPVGGLGAEEAAEEVRLAAQERAVLPIRLIGPGGEERTTGKRIGAEPLADQAIELARDTSALERAWRRLGFGGAREIPLEYELGPVRVARLANSLDERFADPPRNADIRVRDTTVLVRPAAPGTGVDRGALRRALRTLPAEVGLSLVPAAPSVATAEAEAAKEQVDRLLGAPRIVRYQGVSATLWPKRLGSLVRTEPRDGELAVTLDRKGLEEALRPRLGRFERAPRDAGFTPVGDRVRITPARPGRALDGGAIGASLLNNDDATAHLARFRTSQPALTTARARTLGIEQKISEFTTYHPCCAPRVNNIHRGAEIIDGTVILPGKAFDLNEVMGQRTEARGFMAAPQIFNGRLEDAVGGGVSQIATTMYNAAFFGGMQIVTHQPHEFYISRYPMGREATVSWGGPELIWRNDWPAAVLVNMSYTDTSITVRLYSSKLGRKVTSVTGEPCCYTSPQTITVSNPSLPPGTTSTVQSAGPSGFTISYTRKVFRNGKLKRNERYTWRYKPENAIVEVGPPAPAKPKPTPKPKPPAGDEPAAKQTASTSG